MLLRNPSSEREAVVHVAEELDSPALIGEILLKIGDQINMIAAWEYFNDTAEETVREIASGYKKKYNPYKMAGFLIR